jgi:hypothetical protein
MYPTECLYTPGVEIVTVADMVADAEVDQETDARSISAHTSKGTIIPPKHAERDKALTTTPAIRTSPGTKNELATTEVTQDTSNLTASSSNVPGINATKSTRAPHY